jgi:glutamate:Na+ symporter, ESS family
LLELDLVQTLAFGGLVLMGGYGLRRVFPLLGRLNLPAAVLGGLVVSLVGLVAHQRGATLWRFDTTLQSPLMIAFFTTVGFNASLGLLKVGGPQVLRFFVLATLFALLQNVLGVTVALLFGLDPLFGVLAGSVTLTGGPATGLAFAPAFEAAGVTGAASVAVAVAMAGIVVGALAGSPVATWIIERHALRPTAPGAKTGAGARTGAGGTGAHGTGSVAVASAATTAVRLPAAAHAPGESTDLPVELPEEDGEESFAVLKSVVALLAAMWAGSYVSAGFAALGVTLPAYIGAMLVAAFLRNVDDRTGWLRLSPGIVDTIGSVALSLFLVLALMNLKLWELAGLALPLVVGILAQVGLVVAGALFVFGRMGRDYEGAVMSGGFIGFMLGTTANAMAVMRALVERYGPAPRAFLVAPLVGAFFLDFANALLITAGLNLLA